MQQATNQVNTLIDNEIGRLKNNDSNLINLDLSHENLSNNQIQALGEALSNNTRLSKLILNSNIIKNLSLLIAFTETFKNIIIKNTNTSLEEIYFNNTSIIKLNIENYIKKTYPQNSSLILHDWLLIGRMLSKDTLSQRRKLKEWMNTNKENALLIACDLGLLPLVKQLIEDDGLDPNISSTITHEFEPNYSSWDIEYYEPEITHETPLGNALQKNNFEVAKYLLEQKHKPIKINELLDQRTYLMIACDMGDVNSVKLILSYPNVDTMAYYTHYPEGLSYTALTEAAIGYLQALESNEQSKINNYKTIIQLLLEHYYTAKCLNLVKKGVIVQARAISRYYLDSDLKPVRDKGDHYLNQLLKEIYRLNQDIPNAVIRTYATKLINKNFDWGKSFSFFGQQNPSVNRETYYYDTEIRFTV